MRKTDSVTDSTKDKSQQQQQSHSKRSFFINLSIDLIYSLVKIILLSLVFGFISSFDTVSLTSQNSFQRTQQNLWLWQKQIIIDLRVVKGYNCPEGFEDYTDYYWPGNIQGCYCSVKVGVYDYSAVLQGKCSSKQFAKGCLSIPAHSQIPFYYWNPLSHLCLKRLKNYNFYSSQSNIINNGNFPIKNCSVNTNYQIDLIYPIQCPITNMSNNSNLNQSLADFNNSSYQRQSSYPIVFFRISEYNFCSGLDLNDISPNRKSNYILEKNIRSQCESIDTRTILLSQQSQSSLINNNPRIGLIISSLPAYPPPDDHFTYKLGFIRYPSWTYNCRNSQQYNLLTAKLYLSLQKVLNSIKTYAILTYVCLLVGYLYIVYFWISTYFYLKTKHMHGYLYLKDYQIMKINQMSNIGRDRFCQVLKIVFVEIFSIFIVIILTVYYDAIYSAKQWYQNAIICTQDLSFKSYIFIYQQFFGSGMILILTSLFVTIGSIIASISHMVWRICKGDLQQQQQRLDFDMKCQISTVNDSKNLEIINVTEEYLIDNTFAQQNHKIQTINIDSDQYSIDESNSSEYSGSNKSD